ncbi:hypothetical protein [Spiroplasma floricola]|uniref:Uncharacterized protein n=1 Tax=Spiroplasma floricola 23-6 TaxID=1336749 RepID=A0A2K8SE78_9MOLU|nr:hypothetical protein [Spiroplasma floricola]AUB31766.1 hypothetical protein SFLOR_v1c07180 [Spiroplasma floricola 23-6]
MDLFSLSSITAVTKCDYWERDLEKKYVDSRVFKKFFWVNLVKIFFTIALLSSVYILAGSKNIGGIIGCSVVALCFLISLSINCIFLVKSLCYVFTKIEIKKPEKLFIFINIIPFINFIFLLFFYYFFKKQFRKKDYKFIELERILEM